MTKATSPKGPVTRGVRTRASQTPAPRTGRRAARQKQEASADTGPTNHDIATQPVIRTPATGKLGEMVALMYRPGGATLVDLMTATGWQAHSVRGALAGSLKRARGYEIASEKVDGVRVYTIAADAAVPA